MARGWEGRRSSAKKANNTDGDRTTASLEITNQQSTLRAIFPIDCIQRILEFCNTKELLSFRLVSKVWRMNATQLLQDRIIPLEQHFVYSRFCSKKKNARALNINVGTQKAELHCKMSTRELVHVIFHPGNGNPQVSCGCKTIRTGQDYSHHTDMLVAKQQNFCPMNLAHQSTDLEGTTLFEMYKASDLTAIQQLAFQHVLSPEQSNATSFSVYEWERPIISREGARVVGCLRVWAMCLNQDKGVYLTRLSVELIRPLVEG